MNDAPITCEESLESLVGQVADEFLRRQRDGDCPEVEEYLTRYPQAKELLRPVLAPRAAAADREPRKTWCRRGGDSSRSQHSAGRRPPGQVHPRR